MLEVCRELDKWKARVGLVQNDGGMIAPLSVWGDTAPFGNKDSILLLLWGSLATSHPERLRLII